MPVHIDGWNCGTHIAFWILQILRYLLAETINMNTLMDDEHFTKCIGNNVIFKYQIDHDMNKLRAEIRKFIIRLAFVTAASEDKRMTKETIQTKEEAVGSMSCEE
eukprot:8250434-Ditylum_brightwellii.AAC.1